MSAKNGRVREATETASGEKTPVEQFAKRYWDQTIVLDQHFSYFAAGVNIQEDDLKDYVREPIASIPPDVITRLPKVHILFVPFVERGSTKEDAHLVSNVRPEKEQMLGVSRVDWKGQSMLLFTMQEPNLGDFHYFFYRAIARLAADRIDAKVAAQYSELLLAELKAQTHGEVDEESWRLKQELVERTVAVKRKTRGFAAYAEASLMDTLTLYLHGICCDIDVEPGPRQLPSKPLRKRLELFEQVYPPPKGYTIFPDEPKRPAI